MRQNLYGATREALREMARESGEPAYRGDQVFGWLHRNTVSSVEEMTNLPAPFRERLSGYSVGLPQPRTVQEEPGGRTIKATAELEDQTRIESVCMRYVRTAARDRNTACISSQAGCAMGCAFCATGQQGFFRHLHPGEIVGQVHLLNRLLGERDPDARITNVVYMGMGEPLANLDAVLPSLKILHDPQGLDIGYRRITVSTCGLVPGIQALTREGLPLTLAVSLQAPRNELRDRLMPVNRRYPLEELVPACRAYQDKTGRKITLEYVLLGGLNDHDREARELAGLAAGLHCQVNLIQWNPVGDTGFGPSGRLEQFRRLLEAGGVEVSVREEMGQSIDAACGQLRGREGAQWP